MTRPALRLALATCAKYRDGHEDDALLSEAFRAEGVETALAVWTDPDVDWAAFDAVLIRATWDYFERYAEFVQWLDRLEALGVALVNPLPVVRWNCDKRYLSALEAAGVPGVPSREATRAQLAGVIQEFAGREIVVKPTVSGGAWHTVRGLAGSDALAQAIAPLPDHLRYLVQPFVPEISEGEWSLLYFGGRYSHAVLKRPAAGEYRVQPQFGSQVGRAEPDAALRAAAQRALQAAEAAAGAPTAYARIDGVVAGGRFLLMEAELIEPLLFFAGDAEAVGRFARAVTAAVATARLGAACAPRGIALS
jgi:glutathione synthase/RimK-type ligase-like ATP-grasp enzyme